MAITERHSSPDGILHLVVEKLDDDDLLLGFEGLEWHTHGDLLTSMYGGTPVTAIRAFIADIVASKHVIVVSRLNGKIRDAWISDDPSYDESSDAGPGEIIEKRYWNGRLFEG